MSTDHSLLEVTDVEVAYGEARALFGVSFDVPRGIGHRRCSAPTARASRRWRRRSPASCSRAPGRVEFDGEDITGASSHTIAKLGLAYVPESRNLFPHLSVKDNLWAQLRFSLPRAQRKDAYDQAMEMFPVLAERRSAGRGHPLGRRAADAGARARAGGVAEAAHRRRDVARARAA